MKHSISHSVRTLGLAGLCVALLAGCKDDGDDAADEGVSGASSVNAAQGNLLPTVRNALGKANPPRLGARIDDAGRPAITAALIETFNPDLAVQSSERDRYNKATTKTAFRATMEKSLAILDGLDNVCGNQLQPPGDGPRYQALANVLVDDQLYVNSDKTGSVYLGVEAEALGVVPDGAGGGRVPGDDVIERSFSVLVAGTLKGIDDGVPADDAVHSPDQFPFLAGPQ
jgi:hypothetical protein